MLNLAESRFTEINLQSPIIDEFLERKKLVEDPVRIESRWRSANDIYYLLTEDGPYVLKRINQEANPETEINYLCDFTKTYPGFSPEVLVRDGPSFIMEYVAGDQLSVLVQKPYILSCSKIEGIGQGLRNVYMPRFGSLGFASAIGQIPYTDKYSKYDPRVGSNRLTKIMPQWEDPLKRYPAQLIHNDLNGTNTIITEDGRVRSIDTRADTKLIQDPAKDVGRVVASSTCAAYDNHYNAQQMMQMAEAIIKPWEEVDEGFAGRVAFYIGQSYLSFSRWDLKNFTKEGFFDVGCAILGYKPSVYKTNQHIANRLINALIKHATPRTGTYQSETKADEKIWVEPLWQFPSPVY